MPDHQVEDRVRAVLRGEGAALPLTITAEELERRLSMRRRERRNRRFSLIAAGIGAIALGSTFLASSGWLRMPYGGPGSSSASAPGSGSPMSPVPSAASEACEIIDPSTVNEAPSLLMSTIPGNAATVGGQRSAYRLGDRQVGEEGTWDHDTIGMESLLVGHPVESLEVRAGNPDTCLTGMRVDARPLQDPDTETTWIPGMSTGPSRGMQLPARPPAGDWFVRVHADFATIPGATAWAEAFFVVEVADCTPIDTTAMPAPPPVDAAVASDDTIRYDGVIAASEWGGRRLGTLGSWAAALAGPGAIVVRPGTQPLEFASAACLLDATVEGIRIDAAGEPEAGASPMDLPIVRGSGTKVVAIHPPPVGSWALRIRSSFLTADGTPGWSETVFRVESRFAAPGLTIGPEYFEIWAEARCTTYRLTSGASGDDACPAGYGLMEGREPLEGSPSIPLRFQLTEGWAIDEVRVTAVDAALVAAGQFAPEYAVSFQEDVGNVLVVPIELDPGAWIVRLSLNGSREGDTFGATYDVQLTVAP